MEEQFSSRQLVKRVNKNMNVKRAASSKKSYGVRFKLDMINQIALEERCTTLMKYGTVNGKCIETSDRIRDRLLDIGIEAQSKQVWCLYEDFENCMDCCFEEHWITSAMVCGTKVYIDATMDQFQWAFSRPLPEVYVLNKLPNFYLVKKPGKTILDRCGWNDYYNTGKYVNNFNYWG